jgi:NAD(P)-dependent dehydrogenase (short-subunit alcohol dehydrogenase family)
MNILNGKVAVITGGTSGIGKATAVDFIENGARVIITGRYQETVDETVKYLGQHANGFVSDAGKFSDLMDLQNRIEQFSCRVDILFVNAGYVNYAPIELIDEEHFDSQFNVIAKGTLFTVQQILPLMKEGSSIVLNTSIATEIGMPLSSVYSAAKAAVQSFVKTFAADLSKRNIRVNGISPGPIQTNWTDKAGMTKEQVIELEKHLTIQIPLKRMGQPSDIAKVVTFLSSDNSAFMQGSEVFVNGGFPMIRQ